MEEIKSKINNLNDLSNVKDLIKEIAEIADIDEKKECYNEFVRKCKDLLISSDLAEGEVEDKVVEIYSLIANANEVDENGRFDMLSDIVRDNKFDEESILADRQNSQRELTKITSQISALESEVGKFNSIEDIDKEINRLEKEKSEQIKDLSSKLVDATSRETQIEIKNVQEEIKKLQEKSDLLKNDLSIIFNSGVEDEEEEYNRLSQEVDVIELEMRNKEVNLNRLNSRLEKELQEEKQKFISQKRALEQSESLKSVFNSDATDKEDEFNRINQEIDVQEINVIDIELKLKEMKLDEISFDKLRFNSKLGLQQEIERLQKEKNLLSENLQSVFNGDALDKEDEVNRLTREMNAIDAKIEKLNTLNSNSEEKLREEIKQLQAKRKLLQSRLPAGFYSNADKNVALEQQIKSVQSAYDTKISKLDQLKTLSTISNAHSKIFQEALDEFGSKDNVSKEEIEQFVNEHDLSSILDKYSNSEKLKSELNDFIGDNLKKKRITSKEKNKKLLLKGLVAASGVVTGLALSSAPGVGTIRMAAAGVKLFSAWTKKHPEVKISKLIDATSKKIRDNDKVNEFKEKHPKIVAKVKSIRDKLKKISKNEKFDYFINGVSVGYIAGNVIELFTGQTVAQHISNMFDKNDTVVKTVDSVNLGTGNTETIPSEGVTESVNNVNLSTTEPVSNVKPSIMRPLNGAEAVADISTGSVENVVSNIALEPGATYDLSGIAQGFISSDATQPVNLMTSVADDLVFDRIVNGRAHFIQANGKGMAWYDLEEVQEYLAKAGEIVTKGR